MGPWVCTSAAYIYPAAANKQQLLKAVPKNNFVAEDGSQKVVWERDKFMSANLLNYIY